MTNSYKCKYKLSIIVLTMNRADQLVNAIKSCFNCKLPVKTEFVIVDNASTDNTEETIQELFSKQGFPYKYIKEEENRGVGGGRNIGFENAEGEYCYFLDDDAIIAPECHKTFFILPIEHFENDKRISSITTRIYDEALECDRNVIYGKDRDTELPTIFMYLGGSHFLRSAHFEKPLYIDIKYGCEELIPSIYSIDKGLFNCYIASVRIIHQPKVNKWKSKTDSLYNIACMSDANVYASKRLIYPLLLQPLLCIAFIIRLTIHLRFKLKWHRLAWKRSREFSRGVHLRKVGYKTIFRIAKNYSLGSAI